MDQKRDIPTSHKQHLRRKKKKKNSPVGADAARSGTHPKSGPKPLVKTKHQGKPQERHRDRDVREKTAKSDLTQTQGSPRDLRLGSQGKPKVFKPEPAAKHVFKRYGILIYETFAAAKADKDHIAEKAREYDQLNLVIRADGNMDDPELLALGPVKVFAGAAWTLIHERRIQDGWYEAPR